MAGRYADVQDCGCSTFVPNVDGAKRYGDPPFVAVNLYVYAEPTESLRTESPSKSEVGFEKIVYCGVADME